ncbi:acyl-CoA dehydrogenase family protein [Pseudonocardia pini]|uniref:acyl-CoA dehydrogenase family protein n=1 Tax=Pseudonocardia pini TaxID=2758030 RepID=UPI0015F01840|nr:acyl-CoA dehydrogenase family protein [Pseudonocardia pini]
MDLDPTDDQALLLDTSARFVDDVLPIEAVRAFADGAPLDPGYVSAAAELGWFAMFVAEELGGGSVSGDPVADAVLLGQLRGGRLQPEPFAATNTVAAVLTEEELLSDLAAGKATASLAVAGDALWDSGLRAEWSGPDLVLTGTAVVDDPAAAWVLLTATTSAGPAQALVSTESLPRTELNCLDVTRRLGALTLDAVRVPAEAVVPGSVERTRTLATLLSVADSVGALDRLFTMTRQYALDRIAFGRPIGSFQALKHLLADISLVVESAKAVLAAATRAVAADTPYAGEVASIAAVYVGERAAKAGQDCLQVHGGIGFAWEHDLHLYLRRITANAALSGTVEFHRDRILSAHAGELA